MTDGHATWANPQHTSINVMENGALRGLSCRVGSELACAYQQGKAWAQVQVAEIRQQHGPIAIEEDAGVLA